MSATHKQSYQPTRLVVLPSNWSVRRLSTLTKSYAGGTPDRSKPEYFEGDIPWVKSGEVNKRKITNTEERISDVALSESSAKIAEAGSVLVAMYGATAGKVARLKIDAAINQAVLSIRAAVNELDNDYLFWAMERNAEKLLAMCQGAAQPNLSKGLIDGLEIAIPPISEQQKIAAILTAVDDKLDVIARQIEATETLQRGLMQTLFSRGIGTQDADGRWVSHAEFKDSELGRIPASWEVRPIGSLFDVVERSVEMDDAQLYRRVTVKRRFGGIELRDELPGAAIKVKNQFSVEAGDFLISERQIVHGACGVLPSALTGALVSNEYLVLKAKPGTDVRYFNYMVQLLRFKKYFLLCSQGVDIEKFLFKPKDWLKKMVPVPLSEEQMQIADVLAMADQKLQVLKKKQSEYQALQRGLMQKLLSGEWLVKLEDTEPLAA
uniref:Putative Type-1 restriction enzyme MjaXIP specificity protein n=1 Tax=Ralstonia solanacearum TaxID=305 RepID=A0A0S4UZE8_RALSL|nr:putative Type-1 restriction enzyme MjaXIP specificity protein [Ralstonia solanacearum]